MRFRMVSVAGVAAVCMGAPAVAGDATYSDGTFFSGHWTILEIDVGNGGSHVITSPLSGGTPGQWRQIQSTAANSPGPGRRSIIFSIHLFDNAIYDPSLEGPALEFTYSEDSIAVSGARQATGLALYQSGVYFIAPGLMTTALTSWVHMAATVAGADLVAIDPFDLDDGLNQSFHPDLSGTAPPFQIGFYRSVQTALGGTGVTATAGIDNWRVHVMPAPGASLVATFTLLMPLVTRRRRSS